MVTQFINLRGYKNQFFGFKKKRVTSPSKCGQLWKTAESDNIFSTTEAAITLAKVFHSSLTPPVPSA